MSGWSRFGGAAALSNALNPTYEDVAPIQLRRRAGLSSNLPLAGEIRLARLKTNVPYEMHSGGFEDGPALRIALSVHTDINPEVSHRQQRFLTLANRRLGHNELRTDLFDHER